MQGVEPVGRGGETVDLKISAAPGMGIQVSFEPVGTSFVVEGGDFLYLRTPLATVDVLQFVWWSGGVAVWVDYPGDHVVLDAEGNVLEAL